MNESANPILKYFSEFKILKTVSKDFWLTNVVQFQRWEKSAITEKWPIFP